MPGGRMPASFEEIVRHESAHALVAHVLGFDVVWLEMLRPLNVSEEWGGGVHTQHANGFDGAVVALAGPAADLFWDVKSPDVESDYQIARVLLAGDDQMMCDAEHRAIEAVADNVLAIERLAEQLIAELYGRDLTQWKVRIERADLMRFISDAMTLSGSSAGQERRDRSTGRP